MHSAPPILDNEAERLAALRDLFVLDSEPEPLFDAIARQASEVCGVPIALVSLVDQERQWFKANVGLPGVHETPRDLAFCAHTIAGDALFEVADAQADTRFAGNPLVTEAPHIRFYAGAPLVLPQGERIGTLCVIDREARRLDAAQQRQLRSLADIATQALVMRRALIGRSLSVRNEYERRVADSEMRYRAIVEEQSELVSLSQPDGVLVYVNTAYARHFGHTPEQMVGADLYAFIPPSDRAAVRRQLAEVLDTGEDRSNENQMVAADGAEKWVAWTNSLQTDSRGQRLLRSVGRDLTERRRMELAQRASQAFLSRTGRLAGVGGWEVDLDSGTVTWSDETRRIHEVGPDYVPTVDTGIAFYAPEARAQIQAAVQAGMDGGTPWDLELPFVTAVGRSIWVRSVGEVEFADGRPLRLVGAFQDITARKQLEQRLAASEGMVRQITDHLPVRIAYVDREARYRFVNETHCRRFGLDRAQILGRTRSELTGGHTDNTVNPRVAAVLAGQPQRFEYEETVDGRTMRIESQLLPDLDESGQVRGFYSTGSDITARSAAEKALRDLTAILDNTTDYVVQTDARGQITYMNTAARRITGLGDHEPVGQRNFAEFNPPATNRLFAQVIVPAIQTRSVWVGPTFIYGAGKREIPVSHQVIAHRDATGLIDRYSAVMRDMTVEVEAQQQQERHTATLRSITESIPAYVSVVGVDGRYRFVNTGFERWSGATRDAIVGRSMPEVLGSVEAERSRPWVERALRGETVHFEKAYPARHGSTYLAISYIPLWLGNGSIDGVVGVARDITAQKQEEVRLLQMTQSDPLTGLLNRAGFEEHLQRQIAGDVGSSTALLYIDLDRFKPVNDQHGHPVGDQVLQAFAQRLRKLVRPSDGVARLGGDEFAVVLSNVRELADAQAVADKVVAAAGTPFSVDALQLRIGASVGVALGLDAVTGWRDLVARADALLYKAKAGGRGRSAGTG